jgi:hypothetical protein
MRKFLPLFLILLSIASLRAQTLRITEFLATNVHGIVDEDSTPQGWIEIWNPSTTAKVSMNAMKLTDTVTTWVFPLVEIMPDERMIVFASGKNRTVVTSPLHTNFTIPTGGGTIRLLRSDNVLLSEIANFPAQQPDVSWGRDEADIAVSPTQVGFYTEPTPEKRNNYNGPGVAGKVVFSTTSRAYTSSMQVTLSQATPDPNAQIRYTLNGTLPTASSTLYTGPINLTATQQVRARVYQTGLLPGETESNCFLLLDGTTSTFSSAMPIMVLTSFGATISDTLDTPSYLWVWEPAAPDNRSRMTNTPNLVSRIAVDKRGSSTIGNPKFNLNMELRKGRDDDDRNMPLLGMPSESDWVLEGPYEYDRSDIHNPLAYGLSNSIGRYASRVKHAEVFMDVTGGSLNFAPGQTGDYFGIYDVTEKIRRNNNRVDIVNLGKYDNGPVTKTGGYIWKVDRLDSGDTGFSAGGQTMAYYDPKEIQIKSPQRDPQEQYLTNYINSFNSVLQSGTWNDPVNGYAKYMDVDAAVDHFLLNVWPFNLDAFRLSGYWTKERGAKMAPAPIWDYDRTMSSTDGRDANPAVWRSTVPDFGTDFFNYIWWNRLFLDIDFYQKVIDRWQLLRRGPFSRANTEALIDTINSAISAEAITRDVARWAKTKRAWTSPFTGINYPASQAAEVQRIKDYLQQRANFMDSQWVGPVTVSVPEGNVSVGTDVTLAGPSGATIYYTLNGADPRPSGGAAPGGSVLTYTGTPITITETTRLRARAYNPAWTALTGANNPPLVSKWGGLTNVRYSVDTRAAIGNLAVTEINFNPLGPNAAELAINPVFEAKDFEFIELKNIGAQPIDLGGAKFTSGINFTFSDQNAITVAAGAYFIVASNPAAFIARYGSSSLQVVGPWQGDLSNGGERLVIKAYDGTTILDFTYDDAWYPNGDGPGGTYEYIGVDYTNASYNNPANWRDSSQVLGSPGTDGLGPAPNVVINEILTNSALPRVDAIEFFNPTPDPIDISGWYLSDVGSANSTDEYKKYHIPNSTVIQPGGYYVLTEVNFNPNGAWNPTPGIPGPGEFAFNSDHGDDAWLIEADGTGKLTRFVAHVEFGAARQDESWGRWPNGTGKFFPMVQRTLLDEGSATTPIPGLGAPNSTPRFGPLIISEVQHTPAGNNIDLEFVEIYNPTASEQSLAHWLLRGDADFDFTNQTIPAGGTIVVTSFDPADTTKADAFRNFYHTPSAVLAGPWGVGNQLGTTGELVLYRAGTPPPLEPTFYPETVEDEVAYANGGLWPEATGGMSMCRVLPGGIGDLPASWTALIPNPGRPVNSAPVAVTDSLHVPLNGGALSLDVRANDTDPDNDILTITGVGTPANGTAGTDGSVINYTPGLNYNGNDSFSYGVIDGFGASANGMVQLVNAMPVAVPETLHVPVVGGVATLDVLANDIDPDNDQLTIASVQMPANGTATTNGQTITYTPGPNFTGSDQVTYLISDGYGGTATAQATLVNVQPVAAADTLHVSVAGGVATLDVLGNDTDANNDQLVIIAVQTPANGSATTDGQTITYTPGASFTGTDQFNYTISDGHGGTSTAQVTLGNAQPVALADTLHAAVVNGVATLDVLSNDSDLDNDSLAIVSVQTPANGTATTNGATIMYAPGASFTGSDQFNYMISDGHGGTAIGQVTLSNVQPAAMSDSFHLPSTGGAISVDVRANDTDADGDGLTITQVGPATHGTATTNGTIVSFTPDSSYNGNTSFPYTITDGHGGTASGTATLTNGQPVAVNDTADTAGSPVTITVLGNDSDPDSDSLSLVSVANGSSGTTQINGSSVVYTPGASFLGDDTFTYIMADGYGGTATGSVSIRATSVVGRTEAATGAPVPGAPGMVFASLQVPAIGDDGVVAWLSSVKGPSVKSKQLLLGGNPATALFGKGDAVPDFGGPIHFSKLGTPVCDSAGRVVFSATFAGPGVTTKNNVALFATEPGGPTARIARSGDAAPDFLGKTFAKFKAVDASDGETAFLAQLSGKTTGVLAWDGTASHRVLGTGEMVTTPVGAKSVSSISLLSAVPGSPGHPRSHRAGELAMLVGFSDKTKGILMTEGSGDTWTNSVVAVSGQPTGIGGTWKSFGPAALAAPGTVVFAATLGGTTQADDRAIVLLGGVDPLEIAREGQASPIAGANYKSFTDPVANSDGLVSFIAKITGAGAMPANDDVLVRRDAAGTSTVVVREQDPVPDLTGITWKKFVSFALPEGEDAGPIFLAQVAGPGVTRKNNLGLWARASDGALVLLARTGDSILIDGAPKTPTKLTLLNALPPVQGSGRSFNDALRVAFLATFTDATQAVYIVRIP